IHLSAKAKIGLRIHGRIHLVNDVLPLKKEQAEKIIFQLINTSENKDKLLLHRELDFSYEHKDSTTLRGNAYFKRGNISVALRIIEKNLKSIDELGLPSVVYKLIRQKQGLVIITGPTGSGKSTTLAALVDYINQHSVQHIVTIEDPVEYLFEPKKSVFSQRELGSDTLSFSNALRSVLRQDPDIVVIGEMRDPETIMTAMELAETGHLVFGTFHTSGAAQTVARLVANFPPEQHAYVYGRLADVLVGMISQRLIPKIEGGRTAIFEVVVCNSAIRNIIRSANMSQMENTIETGSSIGMVSMKRYAMDLVDKGIIKEEDVVDFFREE
ncbi:MAG TPA: PilT/PilU family type 4a pilus ATPase, partial [Candidatus Peregrinibacteria bacterium]|nr:PilT/PilU family type 4a pilus ATPase [Candidatus Peregrinibacteria bacterium]